MAKRLKRPKEVVIDAAKAPDTGSLSLSGQAPIIEQKVVKAEREVTMAPGFVSLYANDTEIEVSPWDVRLKFGEITENAKPDRPVFKIKATGEVRMSPQHAKQLVKLLGAQLDLYEQRLGRIPQPN